MARKGLIPFDQRSISDLYQMRFKTAEPLRKVPKVSTALSFKTVDTFNVSFAGHCACPLLPQV